MSAESAGVIFRTAGKISGKLNITLKEKLYVKIFIIAILLLRTFSIAYLSLMFDGENLKTKRNKAYEFLKKKFSYTEIFRLILSEIPYKKKAYFPVITDYTFIFGIKVLFAAFPYKKRAIPFAFRIADFEMKGKKRTTELAFIRALRKIIYKQYKMVIISDREFAGKEFVRNILRIKNTDVIVRIKKNTNVTDHIGNIIRLRKYEKSISDCFYGENRGILYIDNNDNDKLIIFGSIRNMGFVKQLYERRMGIEEMFRDMKTGLGLKRIRTGDRIRFKNLIAFSLLAYLTVVISDRRAEGKNEYFSYFSDVIYHMIIEPLLLRQFSRSELF